MIFNVTQVLVSLVPRFRQDVVVQQVLVLAYVIVKLVTSGMDNDVFPLIHSMAHVQDNMHADRILFVI